jgi:heptosyltransferase-3
MQTPERIIISRTDSIGDVLLTLPLCGILKKHFPHIHIIFLGRTYTLDIIRCCAHVDEVLDWDLLRRQSPGEQVAALRALRADTIIHVFPRKEIVWTAKRAGIPERIATAGRLYTLTKCNRLVFFSRKRSTLHEAQLNTRLLKPLHITEDYTCTALADLAGFSAPAMPVVLPDRKGKFRVLLHPLSRGSAVEWGLDRFAALAQLLDPNRFEVCTGGSAEEAARLRNAAWPAYVRHLGGQFDLKTYVKAIGECDAVVAASTGPLHIGALLGIHAVGLYSTARPIHAGRWAPIGPHVHVLESEAGPSGRQAALAISPQQVADLLAALASG